MTQPLNGCELLAFARQSGYRDVLMVVVDRGFQLKADRYVTAYVNSLDDVEWFAGEYHNTYEDAVRRMVVRTGITVLTS